MMQEYTPAACANVMTMLAMRSASNSCAQVFFFRLFVNPPLSGEAAEPPPRVCISSTTCSIISGSAQGEGLSRSSAWACARAASRCKHARQRARSRAAVQQRAPPATSSVFSSGVRLMANRRCRCGSSRFQLYSRQPTSAAGRSDATLTGLRPPPASYSLPISTAMPCAAGTAGAGSGSLALGAAEEGAGRGRWLPACGRASPVGAHTHAAEAARRPPEQQARTPQCSGPHARAPCRCAARRLRRARAECGQSWSHAARAHSLRPRRVRTAT
jgi:hypothetical protein